MAVIFLVNVYIIYRILQGRGAAIQRGSSTGAAGESAAYTIPQARVAYSDRWTLASLSKYRGADGGPILLAAGGNVYDVSSAAHFYGPTKPYSGLVGVDASRSLALSKIPPPTAGGSPPEGKDLAPWDALEDLTTAQITSLRRWAEFFAQKYPNVGVLVDDDCRGAP